MNISKVLCSMALLGAVTLPLHADGVKGRLGVSGLAQAGIPLGEKWVRDNGDTGALLGGQVRYGVAKHIEAALSYDNADLDTGYRVEPLLLSGIYSFRPGETWTPTASLGLGAASAVQNGTFDNLATRVGFGLEYFVTKQFAVGPQVNYTYTADNGDALKEHHILGAGILASYFFGPCSQAAAKAPAAKPVAATPVVPATPPADSDGDGVIDSADQCPGTPSGIAVEANGCPKKLDQKVSLELKVLFDTAKDVVKPEYNGELQRVANFLKAYPDVTAEIEGHTDNTGNREYNIGLSQRRANAIRTALINDFGADANRLTAKGYGPNNPVADNNTADGRSKNRRVVATLTAVKKAQ